jgi:hypothetical protein
MGTVRDGQEPVGYEVVAAWAGGLFSAWSLLVNLAVLGFGVAVVRSGYPATWCGWAAIVCGSLVLLGLVATGDSLPALYHVAPAPVGVALLLE